MNENGFAVDFSIEFGSLYAKSSIPAHGIQTCATERERERERDAVY